MPSGRPPSLETIREEAAIGTQAVFDELTEHDADEVHTLAAIITDFRRLEPIASGGHLAAVYRHMGEMLMHLVVIDRHENQLHREGRVESRRVLAPDLPPVA